MFDDRNIIKATMVGSSTSCDCSETDTITTTDKKSKRMPTALVTGAAGFISSNPAEEIVGREYEFKGIDNFATSRRSNLNPLQNAKDFMFHEADIRNADVMTEVTNGVDYVFH